MEGLLHVLAIAPARKTANEVVAFGDQEHGGGSVPVLLPEQRPSGERDAVLAVADDAVDESDAILAETERLPAQVVRQRIFVVDLTRHSVFLRP